MSAGAERARWPAGLAPPVRAEPLGGGMICRTERRWLADGSDVVVKECPYLAELEAEGIRAMAAAGAPTPEVLGTAGSTLVLEYVAGPPDWPALGRAVARMHRVTADGFGWDRDNPVGQFLQDNRWADDWPTFYARQRVLANLGSAELPDHLARRIRRACDGPLPALLRTSPPPSLVHGDLWAGNVVGGRWLIDPSVCFADREMELAYLQLSGTMPAEMLSAYETEWPPDADFPTRRPALQLHKFLVNVRHFGPERYLPRITAVLDRYGW